MRPVMLVGSALASGVLLLALVAVAASAVGEPVSNFTRDAVAVANVPWYTGSVSLITCMAWAVAASLSFFVAWTTPSARRPSLGLGGLALLLGVDDAMLVHDQIGPGQGVPEVLFPLVYAGLALLVSWWMVRDGSRATISAFVLGGALLAVSLVYDQIFHETSIAIEDSAKLLGVLVWVTIPVLFHQERTTALRSERDADLAVDAT